MLNELNKNHMGGFENYGRDDFYNPDDTWSDTKHPIKPKVFTQWNFPYKKIFIVQTCNRKTNFDHRC